MLFINTVIYKKNQYLITTVSACGVGISTGGVSESQINASLWSAESDFPLNGWVVDVENSEGGLTMF